MPIRNLLLCVGVAALAACSGSQEEVATPAPTDAAATAATTAPTYVPAPHPAPIVSPQLSTPAMDRAVSVATNDLVAARDRCNKYAGALRDGCHKQALAIYEGALNLARQRANQQVNLQ